jgi:hypothetical protein
MCRTLLEKTLWGKERIPIIGDAKRTAAERIASHALVMDRLAGR